MKELKSQADVNAAFAKGRPMVILFATDWCPPCKATKPEFAKAEEILNAEKRLHKVDFYLMNADHIRLKMEKDFDGIPAFVAGHNEGEIRTAVSLEMGGKTAEEIIQYVKRYTD